MKKNNNNFINNATFNSMRESAQKIASYYNGVIKRDDTVNKEKQTLTDEELTKYHEKLYMVRVDFSDERHDAIEITATAKQFYIAYGDTVKENIINELSLTESATERKREPKWEMKNRCFFDINVFTENVNRATAEKKQSETKKQSAKQTTATKKKQSAKKESKTA